MQQLTQNINDRRYFFFSFFKSQSAAVNCIWKRWRRRFYCLKSRLFVARVNGSRAVPLTASHVVVKSKLNGLTGYVCYTPLNFLHQKNLASFCYIDFFLFFLRVKASQKMSFFSFSFQLISSLKGSWKGCLNGIEAYQCKQNGENFKKKA